MKITTWNVNSINSRFDFIAAWLQKNHSDILLLQETKTPDYKFPQEKFKELGYHSYAYGQRTYNGVAILSVKPFDEIHTGFPNNYYSQEKRLIWGKYNDTYIINSYFPNGRNPQHPQFEHKLEFYENILSLLKKNFNKSDNILIAGDFNVAPREIDVWDPQLLANSVGFHIKERKAFQQLLDWGLHDLFALKNPNIQQFSWWDYRQGAFHRNWGMRIDHILTTDNLITRCTSCSIDREARKKKGELKPSDHSPLTAVFKDQ